MMSKYRTYKIQNYPAGSAMRFFVVCPNGKRKEFPTREAARDFVNLKRGPKK